MAIIWTKLNPVYFKMLCDNLVEIERKLFNHVKVFSLLDVEGCSSLFEQIIIMITWNPRPWGTTHVNVCPMTSAWKYMPLMEINTCVEKRTGVTLRVRATEFDIKTHILKHYNQYLSKRLGSDDVVHKLHWKRSKYQLVHVYVVKSL